MQRYDPSAHRTRAGGPGWLEALAQDLGYAVRSFRRSPAFVLVALLSLVALVACYIPARRAAGVDPMVALRAE